MISPKIILLLILMSASLSLFAGEIKIMEVGSKDFFSFERIQPEFIFKDNQAGVNIKLSSSFLGVYLPRDNEIIVKELSLDKETGDITLTSDNSSIVCGTFKKKKNGNLAKKFSFTGACKFDQRFVEVVRRVNEVDTRIQVLEIYLTF